MTVPLPPAGPRPSAEGDSFFAPDPPKSSNAKKTAAIVGAVLLLACVAGRVTLRVLRALDDDRRPAVVATPTFDVDDLIAPPPLPKAPVLAVGQCLSTIAGATVDTASTVLPCTERHIGEVFGVMTIEGDTFPGEEVLAAEGEDCAARLSAYAAAAKVKKMTVYTLQPTMLSWQFGDHTVYCIVGDEAASTIGSVKKGS